MRQQAVSRLNCDQRYIENRSNGESGSERCRRMAMAMVVVIVVVTMMMTVVMLMRVMRRHAFDS
jgi:predicted metalloprotease